MALLLRPNVTVDIYRSFVATSPYPVGGTPVAVAGVRGHLKHHVRHGRFGSASALKWTHVLYLPTSVDIRSAYNSQLNSWQSANADTVLLADYPLPGWCTAFLVVLVQRIHQGQAGESLRVYLDRMQPQLGGCFTAGIITGCCPVALPLTVHATFTLPTGCPCLAGVVIPLSFSVGSGSWEGSQIVCANENLSLSFTCGTTSCDDATLTMTFQNHGTVGPATVNPNCSCSPLSMVFDLSPIPDPGTECDGSSSVGVVITS